MLFLTLLMDLKIHMKIYKKRGGGGSSWKFKFQRSIRYVFRKCTIINNNYYKAHESECLYSIIRLWGCNPLLLNGATAHEEKWILNKFQLQSQQLAIAVTALRAWAMLPQNMPVGPLSFWQIKNKYLPDKKQTQKSSSTGQMVTRAN